MIVRGNRLQQGDRVEFVDNGERISGTYNEFLYPYLLIETGTALWRVLERNVKTINGVDVD